MPFDDALARGFTDGLLEWSASDVVPVDGHLPPGDVVLLSDGSVMAMLLVPGFLFELESMSVRNTRRRQINVLLRRLGDDNVTIAAHLVRHKRTLPFSAGVFQNEFARRLDTRYRATLDGNLYVNSWFLTIIVSPRAPLERSIRHAIARHVPQRWIGRRPVSASTLQELEDRVFALLAYFRQAGARRLGLCWRDGVEYSEIGEALRLILYCSWRPVPHLRAPEVAAPLSAAIYTERVICRKRGIEILSLGAPHFAMVLGLREYMGGVRREDGRVEGGTRTGMLDAVLSAEFPCVMTNIYQFQSRADTQTKLYLKRIRMENGMDQAVSQIEALADVADEVASAQSVRGVHSFSLVVHGDSVSGLHRAAAEASTILSNAGAVPIREDRGSFAAYWSQLPGNAAWMQPRPGKISSRNFTAFASFENFPSGCAL